LNLMVTTIDLYVLDIVYLPKYLNSMALTTQTQQKTAINIEFNFGLYRT
jgi:hypothetical protein